MVSHAEEDPSGKTRLRTRDAAQLNEAFRLVEPMGRRVGGDDMQVDGPYRLLLPREPNASTQQRSTYTLQHESGH